MQRKSDDELAYIIADAAEAARCMMEVNPLAEAKYLRQVEEAASELHRRNAGRAEIKSETGKFAVGDLVAFSKATVSRLSYGQAGTAMTGVILDVFGSVAQVDTKGSWVSKAGCPVRFILTSNLVKIVHNLAFF